MYATTRHLVGGLVAVCVGRIAWDQNREDPNRTWTPLAGRWDGLIFTSSCRCASPGGLAGRLGKITASASAGWSAVPASMFGSDLLPLYE